ncbi:MAG: adenylate/guanylate cyclase domain-containing protein [Terriglobales bacterium]
MSSPKFTQVLNASLLHPENIAELDKFRREITVLFSDIRGSTAYFEKYGDIAGVMMVHQCTEILRKQIDQHHGVFIKTIGDAVMATYDNPKDAVESAIGMHLALKHRNANRPTQDHIKIRIGLNFGPGIVRSGDVFGDVVNVASRVESVAQPDQIVISHSVNQKVSGVPDFKISYLGKFALKGKEAPSDLFEVTWDETKGVAPPVASHTIMAAAGPGLKLPTFVLEHVVAGSGGRKWELKGKKLTIGQTTGDVTFPDDGRMAEVHARFSADVGQLLVEDLSDYGVFVRLVATYTLQENDVILMGTQMLRLHQKAEALHAAASTGTGITNLSALIHAPVGELVVIGPDGQDTAVTYPLNHSEVTFGRSGSTFSFPDDEFMSRTHAKVYHRGENFFIEDCSRNGTFLKVRGKVPVPPGSSVIIGSQIFRVSQLP